MNILKAEALQWDKARERLREQLHRVTAPQLSGPAADWILERLTDHFGDLVGADFPAWLAAIAGEDTEELSRLLGRALERAANEILDGDESRGASYDKPNFNMRALQERGRLACIHVR